MLLQAAAGCHCLQRAICSVGAGVMLPTVSCATWGLCCNSMTLCWRNFVHQIMIAMRFLLSIKMKWLCALSRQGVTAGAGAGCCVVWTLS